MKLLERVAAARARAERETYDRVAHLLTAARRAELDGLLVVDPGIGMTRLRWLGAGPTDASATAVKTEVGKLVFLRGLGAHPGFVRPAGRTPPAPGRVGASQLGAGVDPPGSGIAAIRSPRGPRMRPR